MKLFLKRIVFLSVFFSASTAMAGVLCENPTTPGVSVVTGVSFSAPASISVNTTTIDGCATITGTLTTDNNDIDTGTGDIIVSKIRTSSSVTVGTSVYANSVVSAGTLLTSDLDIRAFRDITAFRNITANGTLNSTTANLTTVNATTINTTTVNATGVITAAGGFNASNQKITNVAAGTAPTDAVNFSQLSSVQGQVDTLGLRVNEVAYEARHGIAAASALAMLPAPTPGKNFSMGIGMGSFRGAQSVAIGANMILPETRVQLKLGGSVTGAHQTFGAGLGWSF